MKKISYNIADRQHELIKKMAERLGISQSEALRRIIDVYSSEMKHIGEPEKGE